ncbi:MDR family MFS transporter [Metasolibacillus meyeri]|uniref:MDR family MFS transporter n=1 Tax=Metasolibacillus meyeri TaxID=1071052 RepID=UPI000D327EDA|nr:MFS transporter [Metasolibacillus meyeri]
MQEKYVWDTSLKIRLGGETLFHLFYWMYFPFIAIYFSQSLGKGWTGLLMMLPPVISLVAGMVGGSLTDRLGRRTMMLWGTAMRCTMFVLFASSPFIWLDYMAFLGITIGTSIYKPASDAMVADLVPAIYKKEVFAAFLTGSNIGAVIGPILGAWLFFNYRELLLWGCALILIIYFLFILIKVKESAPISNEKMPISVVAECKSCVAILKDRLFACYLVAGIFSVIAIMQLDLYLAIYVFEYVPTQTIWSRLTLSSQEILGWMLGINDCMFVLFVLPTAIWLKKWTDRNVFIFSCLLAGIGIFLVGFTTSFWMLLIWTVVFTFGEIIRAPVLYNFVSEYAPVNARGQYMVASNMQFTIGHFLAPMTVTLSAWLSPIFIFGGILLCAFISMLLYMMLYKQKTSTI